MSSQAINITAEDGGIFSAYLARPAQGSGPGLVLLHEVSGINDHVMSMADCLAEEGYVVLVPELVRRMQPAGSLEGDAANFIESRALDHIAATLDAIRWLPEQAGKVAVVGYGPGGRLAMRSAASMDVDCAVSYYGVDLHAHLEEIATIRCPMVFHFAENDAFTPAGIRASLEAAFADKPLIQHYVYPGCGHAFAMPGHDQYDKPAALMAYSRSLSMLRRVLGPVYDLDRLWEEHCHHEFATRDVDAVMPTMVAEPYVNHVPTMTGGVGHDQLKRFYKYHFVDSNPADTRLIPVSRTIGSDRVVDEFVFCATHDREIDWLLPGLRPTGKYFEVPMLAVIRFRGDKLYNEHIYWDQASVLVQIGVLDPAGLPVAGIQAARKMVDETLPSNTLMPNWAASEGKPL